MKNESDWLLPAKNRYVYVMFNLIIITIMEKCENVQLIK